VILGGVVDVPGTTMFDKMTWLRENRDDLRLRMVREPRGFPAANCNLVLPSSNPEAAAGYVIMEQVEYPGMSGTNTMCVVTASFTLKPDETTFALFLGSLAIVGVGLATGVFNATLIRILRLPSIIATLGTFSILEGASLLLRDHPEGPINGDVIDALNTSIGVMPVAFIGVVVLVVLADVWLYRTRTGTAVRAVGLDEISSRRLGMSTGRIVFLAFVVCAVFASIAGFYSAAQVQIGSPIIGDYALTSIAAAVLGGASLAGGRGSFVGTLLAAFFLSLISNVLPLFQQPTEYAQMTIGALILLALVLYQAPELIARFRSGRQTVGRLRTREGDAPAA